MQLKAQNELRYMKMVKELEEEMKNLGVDSDSEEREKEKENEPQNDPSKDLKPIGLNKQRIHVNRPNIGFNTNTPNYAMKTTNNKPQIKHKVKNSNPEDTKIAKASPKNVNK